MRTLAALSALLILSACTTTQPLDRVFVVSPDPAHSSRTSLDWAGSYTGTLPCADCPGIELHLTLNTDGSYQQRSRYIDRQTDATQVVGRYEWTYDGNHIQLDAAADHAFYAVHEGSLLRRYADGSWPASDRANTMRLSREP